MRLQENAIMKIAKLLFLTALFTAVLARVNQQAFLSSRETAVCMRVRTVPSSTDQKKKDNEQEATPKTPEKSTNKQASGFNINDANMLKATLAFVDGGAPK